MKTQNPVVFYSWQSDHSKTRSFIEKALNKAISDLNEDPTLELAPRLDKDLKGKVGAINIPVAIRKKIDNANIFVADLTLVDQGKTGRNLANQNVIYELGYAAGKLGEEATIILLNKDLADKKLLPFDIAQNRVEDFSIVEDPKGVKLVKSLKHILTAHLDNIRHVDDQETAATAKDKLIFAIENNKPARRISEEYFNKLFGEYIQLYPGRLTRNDNFMEYGKRTYESYANTLPLSREFYDVVSLIAEYKNKDALLACYKKIEKLSSNFDVLPSDHGWLHDASKDYYAFITNEAVSIILGCVAKERWWAVLKEIADVKLKRGSKYDKPITIRRLYHFPQTTVNYYHQLKGIKFHSPTAVIIRERYTQDEEMLHTYIDGNILFWALTGDYPWVAGLVVDEDISTQYEISFLSEFKKASFIKLLATAYGSQNIELFKRGIWSYAQHSLTGWSSDTLMRVFKEAGINSIDELGAIPPQTIRSI